MGNMYSDISKKEQLSFCLWSVKKDLEILEDFLGFFQLTNIKNETIVNAVKDALLIFNFQFENWRG